VDAALITTLGTDLQELRRPVASFLSPRSSPPRCPIHDPRVLHPPSPSQAHRCRVWRKRDTLFSRACSSCQPEVLFSRGEEMYLRHDSSRSVRQASSGHNDCTGGRGLSRSLRVGTGRVPPIAVVATQTTTGSVRSLPSSCCSSAPSRPADWSSLPRLGDLWTNPEGSTKCTRWLTAPPSCARAMRCSGELPKLMLVHQATGLAALSLTSRLASTGSATGSRA